MPIKFCPYAWWLMCCVIMFATSCTKNEAKVEDPVTQQTGVENKRHINYAIVQGDTLDIGNYKLVNVYDTFEILQIDGIDAISYDGKYGYVLNEEWESEEYIYELSVKDLKSGKTIRSAWLIDIIRNSEFAEELDSYYLFNDTIDTYYIPDTIDSNSDSIKSYYIREYEDFGKYYYQQSGIEQIFASTRGIVIGSRWHYYSPKNTHAWFYIFINNNLELEYFLTVQNAEAFVDFCIMEDYFQFANGSMISSIKHDIDNKTIEEFQWGGYIIFDYLTLEYFYKCAGTLYSGKDQRYYSNTLVHPLAIIQRKMFYLFSDPKTDPVIVVKDLNSKQFRVIESPSLLSLIDSSRYINSKRFTFAGISEDYIFIRRPLSQGRIEKDIPIFAIPRKILDYAN